MIFKQVLNTILLCHINGVLHRYIKDENALIHRENLSVKLIDFASGTYLHDGLYNEFLGESFPLYIVSLCPENRDFVPNSGKLKIGR